MRRPFGGRPFRQDPVCTLAQLPGIEYRPALADLPDQRGWRIDAHADYRPLNTLARGRIDLARVRRHWPYILRMVGSSYSGALRAYDVVRMLQRDGRPSTSTPPLTSSAPRATRSPAKMEVVPASTTSWLGECRPVRVGASRVRQGVGVQR